MNVGNENLGTDPETTKSMSVAKDATPLASKAQLEKAIDDLGLVRSQISTILQSLRGVVSGELTPPSAPPVDGPSIRKTPA